MPAPPVGLLLTGHVFSIAASSIFFINVVWMVPLLVRLHFGSEQTAVKDFQTLIVTMTVMLGMSFSIFWNELLRRVPLRTYLLIFWLVAVFPLGCLAFVQNYPQLLICHVLGACGFAGHAPVNGKLLQSFYPAALRGRAYAVLNVANLIGGIFAVFVVGEWMEADPQAFRLYFPIAALIQIAGIVILMLLARWNRTADRPEQASPASDPPPRSLKRLLAPVLHMNTILRGDRVFSRYELAFMTYGIAFMFCDALLPVLGTDRLHLRYADYAHATQMASKIAMLVAMLPMGLVMDRLGPMRTSGIAFGTLTLYPILLALAWDMPMLVAASLAWGVGLAGVQMGWMLGPVALARTPEQAPHYVAIHATLVGVRGLLFQGLGMLVYKLTGGFTTPMVLAAAAFLAAAIQMWRLHAAVEARQRAAAPSAATAAFEPEIAAGPLAQGRASGAAPVRVPAD